MIFVVNGGKYTSRDLFSLVFLSDQALGGEVAGDVDLPFEKIKERFLDGRSW